MGVGISDEQLAVGDTQAAGFAEGGAGEPAVGLAAKERFARTVLGVEYLDFAVVGVGDVELAVVEGDAQGVL